MIQAGRQYRAFIAVAEVKIFFTWMIAVKYFNSSVEDINLTIQSLDTRKFIFFYFLTLY